MKFSDAYTQFRTSSVLKKSKGFLKQVKALSTWAASLSDEELPVVVGQLSPQSPESLPKAFALTFEAVRRVKGLSLHDVQLIGGYILANRKLAEMKTGEGKTLTIAAPAVYLALHRQGVHIVTANQYLAQRDAEELRDVYALLGLTVDFTSSDQSPERKKEAYSADITYGVGSEFGFDYLKDNLALTSEQTRQRPLFAAIVDEVDAILIDEARVPLIIATKAKADAKTVETIARCVSNLEPGTDFQVEVKKASAILTEVGYEKVENQLVELGVIGQKDELYLPANLALARKIHAAVKARCLYRKNRDYVVDKGLIVLIDTGTGRTMPGRRLEDGIHESLEAMEGLEIEPSTMVQATITYQSFFGMYPALAGLTGTAATEADEFTELYGLDTIVVPTNKPIQRVEEKDMLFVSKAEKFARIVDEAKAYSGAGQPVLIGCATPRDADVLSAMLSKKGLVHNSLTARNTAVEASLIAQAGLPGAITVATNLAGRGTDIILGGPEPRRNEYTDETAYQRDLELWSERKNAVVVKGGLVVLGSERNGIRRVDNQLAGRSGRQGNPGKVKFFLSLEDDLLKHFGESKALKKALSRIVDMGLNDGKMVSQLIEKAQRRVEGDGFSSRKQLLQTDLIFGEHRNAIYQLRKHILESSEEGLAAIKGLVLAGVESWSSSNHELLLNTTSILEAKKSAQATLGIDFPFLKWTSASEESETSLPFLMTRHTEGLLENLQPFEGLKVKALEALDLLWTEHLTVLEELKMNMGLKGTSGLNPQHQFGKEAHQLFKLLEQSIQYEMCRVAFQGEAVLGSVEHVSKTSPGVKVALAQDARWILRNDPCPCESGLLFKKCHGKLI